MKTTVYIILFFSVCMNAFAQTDTIYIVKTDTVFVPENRDILYKQFIADKGVETNHMWKLNLADFAFFSMNLGYEQKIGRMWSTEGYVRYGLTGGSVKRADIYNNYIAFLKSADTELQLKYFYDMNRRNRLGKRTYGFSGNYISGSLWYTFFEGDPFIVNNATLKKNRHNYSIGLKYGIQRYIGNLVYFDGFAGVFYNWEQKKYSPYNPYPGGGPTSFWDEYLYWVIGIRIGFGIDSFKNLGKRSK